MNTAKLKKRDYNRAGNPTLKEMGYHSYKEFQRDMILQGHKTWIKDRHYKKYEMKFDAMYGYDPCPK